MAQRDLLGLADLDLKELVTGIGNQLRYVDRFATCRRNHKENVAEHQFYTAFFTLLIMLHLKEGNTGVAVCRALVHDVEEHYTGDVVRPVKHGDKSISEGFDKTGAEFTQKFFKSLSGNTKIVSGLFDLWRNAKDKSVEGRVVKFADFLSVLAYLDQEVRSGNKLVLSNVNQLKVYCENFQGEEFNFIRPLVSQAFRLVEYLDNQVQKKRSKS